MRLCDEPVYDRGIPLLEKISTVGFQGIKCLVNEASVDKRGETNEWSSRGFGVCIVRRREWFQGQE